MVVSDELSRTWKEVLMLSLHETIAANASNGNLYNINQEFLLLNVDIRGSTERRM
jgi:hypothetical protein